MDYPTSLFDEISDLKGDYVDSFENEDMDTDSIQDEIDRRLNNAGYSKEIGGTYRDVYSHESNNHVVKFAVGRLGSKENSAEIRNNTRMSKARIQDVISSGWCDGDKYIADILDYQTGSHKWIIMEKVTVTSNNVTVETANQIQQAFADAGIHISEIEPVNMGVKNEIPVIFDYAGT